MADQLALDWDSTQLRWVVGSLGVVRAAGIESLEGTTVRESLRSIISDHGLADAETMVAIGRSRVEIRELSLPPVPPDELPAMVRFQAVRAFASAGESATIDFIVTGGGEEKTELFAAAMTPESIRAIRETCESVGLKLRRIVLRPLAAAALFGKQPAADSPGRRVLIDILGDQCEFVMADGDHVHSVRTVRLPASRPARTSSLVGELRRTLMASGQTDAPEEIVLWGQASVHADEADSIRESLASAGETRVEILDPFSLVKVDAKASLPEHVGRLAPLVGLIDGDDADAAQWIDFLNPRRRVEIKPDRRRPVLLAAAGVLLPLLLGYFAYRRLANLDADIAEINQANAAMKTQVDAATASIRRTESVDRFLDGDVNWLNQLRRLAETMPPSDRMIVRGVAGTASPREGGGRLVVSGAVTTPEVIEEFESAIRDDQHVVVGDGAKMIKTDDAYRWLLSETILIDGETVRNRRYAAINELLAAEAAP